MSHVGEFLIACEINDLLDSRGPWRGNQIDSAVIMGLCVHVKYQIKAKAKVKKR